MSWDATRERLSAVARPSDALPPDWSDLHFLYHAILLRRATCVLELGSGLSTLAIACALEAQGDGFCYSYDTVPKWADSTRAALTVARLTDYASVHVTNGTVKNGTFSYGERCRPYDFAYIDGPELTDEIRRTRIGPGTSWPPVVLVDGREQTAELVAAVPFCVNSQPTDLPFYTPHLDRKARRYLFIR